MLYIIKNLKDDLIKIGISKHPEKRLRQLQTGNGDKLALLKTYEVTDEKQWEKRLHKMFWQHRKKGEWFKLSPLSAYLNFIDELLGF